MKAQEAMPAWEMPEDPISERAAELFANRRFGPWTDEDEAALDAWLAESALNRVAWLRVRTVATCADEIGALHDFRANASRHHRDEESGAFRGIRKFVFPAALAASLALLAAGGIPLARYLMRPVEHTYSTDVGGQTLLKFADGTQIELNTSTTVRYRMTTAERTVWLERGEAWFHVAHDAANPFSVIIGNHRVTDLGTEFLIRRNPAQVPGQVEVAVLSGRASLSTEGVPSEASLKAGDDAIATQSSLSITRKTAQELADELAWQRGVLVFRNARLADVVGEFNRYNTTKLVIGDPSIGDLRLSAELQSNDYIAFLNLAEMRLNLRAEREGQDIVISRAAGKSKKAARNKRGL